MICSDIQALINYAVKNQLIEKEDEIVIRNQLLDALRADNWTEPDEVPEGLSVDDILKPLIDYACENGVIEDTAANRDLFDTRLMGILTPLPREVNREFRAKYSISPKTATDWYYSHSKATNYVRAGRIAKDLKWTYKCEFGTLDITVNRSKPEKDPRDIAAARKASAAAYPKCQLCTENMGYAGRQNHPARQNLRPIPIEINGGLWYLQYSPYGYYNEHCIVFNDRHIPMVIDAAVFDKLFDFIELFPHYFIGSNADLPIVGGSILSHEHFQGGGFTFAMANAEEEKVFPLKNYPDVHAAALKWAMSVIRLRSKNRAQLAKACAQVLKQWRCFTDEASMIFAETDGTLHNTITPIARMKNGEYECDLVLRNNLTTDDRPLGLYHPRPEYHHIKKENIGLIEVMGLAVLPARLADELNEMKNALLSGSPVAENHAEWAKEVISKHPEFNEGNAMDILKQEVGAVFEKVLLDAGVFKRTEEGFAAFDRFIRTL